MALGRLEEAEAAAQRLTKIEPKNPQSWITIANVATRLMRQEEALEAYEQAARLRPMAFGCGCPSATCKRLSAGAPTARHPTRRRWQWIRVSRKPTGALPTSRTTLSDAEIETMQRLLTSDRRERSNEAQLHFALGKAFEQREQYADAFAHYARGNALRRLDAPFDIEQFERRTARICAFFDKEFFAGRAGSGNPDPAPIFIVGLPRSGSTLVEQILASHSRVEGTMELPNIINITHQFDDMVAGRDGYPETVGTAPVGVLTALGTRYLRKPRRSAPGANTSPISCPITSATSGSSMPSCRARPSSTHAGIPWIAVSAPSSSTSPRDRPSATTSTISGATTVAICRSWTTGTPCCPARYCIFSTRTSFAIRKQHPPPPRSLPAAFEAACLAFHQTRRSVRTASAEQVRQPIYTSGVGHWRHFEKELQPLQQALGDSLERF